MRSVSKFLRDPRVKDIVQRAVFTFAQTLGASMLATGSVGVMGVTTIAWGVALDVAAFATLISVLQNIARYTKQGDESYPLTQETIQEHRSIEGQQG